MVSSRGLLLVVADDAALHQQITRYLSQMRFELMFVRDGAATFDALQQRSPRAVLINGVLPRDSGYELCEALRKDERFSELPLLLMTDQLTPENRAFAEEAGVDGFLPMPFTREQLISQVRGLLERRPLSMRSLRMPWLRKQSGSSDKEKSQK